MVLDAGGWTVGQQRFTSRPLFGLCGTYVKTSTVLATRTVSALDRWPE
jgi:hypothetical protein